VTFFTVIHWKESEGLEVELSSKPRSIEGRSPWTPAVPEPKLLERSVVKSHALDRGLGPSAAPACAKPFWFHKPSRSECVLFQHFLVCNTLYRTALRPQASATQLRTIPHHRCQLHARGPLDDTDSDAVDDAVRSDETLRLHPERSVLGTAERLESEVHDDVACPISVHN
jgi:hypothetical protein